MARNRLCAAIPASAAVGMWAARRPYHWHSEGQPAVRSQVSLGSQEGLAIAKYLMESLPEGTKLEAIERWESRALFMPYDYNKQAACDRLNWSRHDVESWLFSWNGFGR